MAASAKPPCRRSAWPGLALDLLGDVLSRLPSLADRVRFRAVCRAWRTGAKLLPRPRPLLPWIALRDGTVLDFTNKRKHRLCIPKNDAPYYSAGENMLFVRQKGWRCSLVNGFSGTTTPLPELAALLESDRVGNCLSMIRKVVMSSPASSPNHQPLVAVLVSDLSKSRVFISTCRPAGEINSCVAMREEPNIADIAFFQGKLYAHLSMFDELFAIDLGSCSLDKPTPPGVEPEVQPFTLWIWPPDLPDMHVRDLFDSERLHAHERILKRHLVESNGKLLMVRRRVPTFSTRKYHLTCRFEVFEADLSDGPRLGRWKKADNLEGRALFVSTMCIKSVRATDGDGARADCIYFLEEYGNPLRDSGVYSVVEKTITPLMPLPPVPALRTTAEVTWHGKRSPAWFFPVEV